ncbi:MAG: coproporphyrinogen III oxidase [Micavibrio sp.]|nr:MAG: coproporphyrinogen III oxidase [Micavibrio sp.]
MTAPGFGIYVHWPFCLAKCPYCDFNSHVQDDVDHARWRGALVREVAHYAEKLPQKQNVTSIFFGGGTPSLMPPDTVAAVIAAVREYFPVAADAEITLEANPTSAEAARFQGYAEAGVNRVSLGVQSLRDAELQFLGRQHSAKEALAALEMARQHFPRSSFDLIYARPGQTAQDWREELAEALSYAAGHLSLYQLTIEKATPFYTLYQRGEMPIPSDDEAAALYDITREKAAAAGYTAYEVSNYARAGEESRHNLVYWRYGDYLGIGPGAHGRITLDGKKYATRAHRAPQIWLERVEKHGHGAHGDTQLSREDRAAEMLLMGLRLAEPLSLARLEAAAGGAEVLNWQEIRKAEAAGWLAVTEAALQTTEAGRLRLEYLLSRIVL